MKRTRFCVWLVCTLAALVCFPLFVSAGAQGEGTTSRDEVLEVTWEGRLRAGVDITWAQEEIEKKFNIRIVPTNVGANDGDEKVQVYLATEGFPDVGNYWLNRWQMYDDGLIRSIPKDMMVKHAPNYVKFVNENPIGWLMNKTPDTEGEYIAVLGTSYLNDANRWGIGFRADWAENVGFDLPNWDEKTISCDPIGRLYYYTEDISVDDWERLLTLFKNNDPDQDGKDDTIPWGGCLHYRWTWNPLAGAYNCNVEGGNWEENGKLVDWRISERYKQFLTTASRWYSKGLIDKEYPNLDLRKAWEKTGGEHTVAMQPAMVEYGFGSDTDYTRPPANLASVEEVENGAKIAQMAGPTGPGGHKGSPAYAQVTSMASYQVFIGSQVTDEKLGRILELLDWLLYDKDEDWFTYFYMGKPGVHCDWTGEPWNSNAIRRKPEDVPEGYSTQGDLFATYPPMYSKSRMNIMYSPYISGFHDKISFTPYGEAQTMRTYRYDLFNETNLQAVISNVGETLDTMNSEFDLRVIIGEIDLEAEWDSYVQKWLAAGGREYIAELEKAPIVSELRKGFTVY